LVVLNVFLSELPDIERGMGYAVFAAAFIGYFVVSHGMLRKEWKARSPEPPKRLLFLRVYAAPDKRERLLDILDDSWRRMGRIDLIGGTDLAMRTLRSLMLEYFLLRRIDAEFLKTAADVDARVARLRTDLEADLRYPINEIYCYADAWQAAVMKLAPAADVVLLDLRGFTRANSGCAFELSNVIWHVPLPRVVVLTDSTTDDNALREVALEAWAAHPSDSPNAGTPDPLLRILPIDGAEASARVPLALFSTLAAGKNQERPEAPAVQREQRIPGQAPHSI
jgi:hypothetical protein